MKKFPKLDWKRAKFNPNKIENSLSKNHNIKCKANAVSQHYIDFPPSTRRYGFEKSLIEWMVDPTHPLYFELLDGALLERHCYLEIQKNYHEDLFFLCPDDTNSKVILTYKDENNRYSNLFSSLRIKVEKNAHMKLIRKQDLGTSNQAFLNLFVEISEGASFELIDLAFGAQYRAMNTEIQLKGNNATTKITSLYIVEEKCTSDFSYSMIHQAKKTDAVLSAKGILKNNSVKVFRDNLDYDYLSSEAKGREEENVLLLGDTIENHSIPALKCHEDNVVGEHAASISRINEKELFYLMSRGFTESNSQKMLGHAFLYALVDDLQEESVSSFIREQIERRLRDV